MELKTLTSRQRERLDGLVTSYFECDAETCENCPCAKIYVGRYPDGVQLCHVLNAVSRHWENDILTLFAER